MSKRANGLLNSHTLFFSVLFLTLTNKGLFNFLIFIRPRYLAIRLQQQQQQPRPTTYGCLCDLKGRWKAFQQAVWYPVGRPGGSSSRNDLADGSSSDSNGVVSGCHGRSSSSSWFLRRGRSTRNNCSTTSSKQTEAEDSACDRIGGGGIIVPSLAAEAAAAGGAGSSSAELVAVEEEEDDGDDDGDGDTGRIDSAI